MISRAILLAGGVLVGTWGSSWAGEPAGTESVSVTRLTARTSDADPAADQPLYLRQQAWRSRVRELCRSASDELASIDDVAATPALVSALKSTNDEPTRRAIVRGLGQIDDAKALQTLVNTSVFDEDLRPVAIEAIQDRPDQDEALRAYFRLLRDGKSRSQAIKVIRQAGLSDVSDKQGKTAAQREYQKILTAIETAQRKQAEQARHQTLLAIQGNLMGQSQLAPQQVFQGSRGSGQLGRPGGGQGMAQQGGGCR